MNRYYKHNYMRSYPTQLIHNYTVREIQRTATRSACTSFAIFSVAIALCIALTSGLL